MAPRYKGLASDKVKANRERLKKMPGVHANYGRMANVERWLDSYCLSRLESDRRLDDMLFAPLVGDKVH